jgi:hypothetical protein
MSDSKWYNFLYYWSFNRTEIGSGLTLPFLIGVEFLENKELPKSTLQLLNEIDNNDLNILFSIHYCPNIGEYILQLNEQQDIQSLAYYKKYNSLFIGDSVLNKKQGIFEISQFLDKKYMKYILNLEFSKDSGDWRKFNNNELQMIKNCG